MVVVGDDIVLAEREPELAHLGEEPSDLLGPADVPRERV
jgi:hypothetical protein